MGLSLGDFRELTLSELTTIYDHWSRRRDEEETEAWRRTRMLACMVIQPFVKQSINPMELLPLKGDRPEGAQPQRPARAEVSRQEARARYLEYVSRNKKM